MTDEVLAGPDQPLPRVSDLDAEAFTSHQQILEQVIESLRVSGGCIIRKFITPRAREELKCDFAPHFAKAKPLKSTKSLSSNLIEEIWTNLYEYRRFLGQRNEKDHGSYE